MMSVTILHMILILIIGIVIGMSIRKRKEGFETLGDMKCDSCGDVCPCKCPSPKPRPVCPACPPCREPDLSKYVLKSTIPPCPKCPDLSKYMLKTECPPVPDLSKYVLKSSIPKPQPVILDCSKCNKPKGECPPCPRARCPEVKCPEPVKCPACAPCPRATCPPSRVKCKAEPEIQDNVRPFLAPLDWNVFGGG
jgi:hypothetical protein